MDRKLIGRTFIKQHDQTDCGVACLASIIRFYGGRKSLEVLRELSGTSVTGTTMLGLYQAAQKAGLNPEGLEAGTDYLKAQKKPSIIHVVMEGNLQHYMVCYGFANGKFIMGDPAHGIVEYPEKELDEIWQSKTMLELDPTAEIEQVGSIKKEKRNWFVQLIKADVNILTVVFLLTLVISILGLIMAIFSQKLIDDILPNKDTLKLVSGLAIVTLLLFMKGGLAYIAGLFGIRQGKEFNNRLIGRFYENLLFLPKSFFDNRRIGELVARLDDTAQIQRTIATVVGGLLNDALLFIVGEFILFAYSFEIGLFSLVTMPVFITISLVYHKSVIKAQREVMVANAHKSSNYVNTMQGIDTIKANIKEGKFGEQNRGIYAFFQDRVFSLGKIGISLQFVAEFAGILIMIGLLGYGSYLVYQDSLTIGRLIAILSITGSIFPAFTSLAFANITLQGAKVAFDRMYEFSAIKPEIEAGDKEEFHADIQSVALKNIAFRFPGRKQLLKDANLEVSRGELVALFGESGGGKTTLLNILQRFYRPESGEVLVNQHDFYAIPVVGWREKIGVIPQEISLFNGTLVENIALGHTEEELKACIEFCDRTGFSGYFNTFPQGYGTLLGEEGINISGGQKQLVALARILHKKPQLLLLDEPTAAMDRNTENFAMNLLHRLKDETAVIVVTHRVKIARYADNIYILENGKIDTSGRHDELMKSDNLYSLSYNEII